MENNRTYILDSKQGNYPIYDVLDWDELYSLENSNVINWSERKVLRRIYMPQRIIREFIPIIGLCAIGHILLEFIEVENVTKQLEDRRNVQVKK